MSSEADTQGAAAAATSQDPTTGSDTGASDGAQSELVGMHRYQIDLEVRSQLLFEKYMALPPPSVHPRGLMGKDKLALLMRDVGVLQLADDDKAAVLQELELSDVDEDCLLSFAEFVTFVRYLLQRASINAAVLEIIHDEYQEARRRTVFRNFCDVELRLGRRGLANFLKELKVFKLLNKFDRTMCWTASTVTRSGGGGRGGGNGGEEYIPFRNFVSTTIPMIAAKVFASPATKPGRGAATGGGGDGTSTSEAISRVWEEVDQAYIHLCKHAERRNVLVQLLPHEERLLMRAFVGADSMLDLAEVHKCLDRMPHTDRAPALAQLVRDVMEEMCEEGSTEVLFTEFVSLVPHRFVAPLETGCIISLNAPKPPSVERSAMHPRDLEVIFRHFDVDQSGTIHLGQLEDMMTALQLRHKLKDLQSIVSAAKDAAGGSNNAGIEIGELMALVSTAASNVKRRPKQSEGDGAEGEAEQVPGSAPDAGGEAVEGEGKGAVDAAAAPEDVTPSGE